MKRTVNVTWRAFGDRPMIGYEAETSTTFEIETDLPDWRSAKRSTSRPTSTTEKCGTSCSPFPKGAPIPQLA